MMKSLQRTFIPGSLWFYLKIYAGNKTMEKILIYVIGTTINRLRKKQLIQKWFFIRYADPNTHLRVRILMNDEKDIGVIINIFYSFVGKYIKEGSVWKIQIDTYNRELERYGIELIEQAESVFTVDSDCILSITQRLNRIRNENYRWMIALKLIDSLLTDFSLTIQAKQHLMDSLNNSFKMEFGYDEFNAKQFNAKFRENKKIIEGVLRKSINDSNLDVLSLPIRQRSKKIVPIIDEIMIKLNRNKQVELMDLLSSYIHMSMNRLFISKNRLHELVLYDFMRRYYTSEIVRSANQLSSNI